MSIPLGKSGETVSGKVAADGSLQGDGRPVLEGWRAAR